MTDITQDTFTMIDGDRTWPFIEDEDARITGYGHQDEREFARVVTEYDRIQWGTGDHEGHWEPSDVEHRWVAPDPDRDGWFVSELDGKPVTTETPGAEPVTTMWNCR